MFCCHSILECYDLFSGVKLSIRSFVLLLLSLNAIFLNKYNRQCSKVSCINSLVNRILKLERRRIPPRKPINKRISPITAKKILIRLLHLYHCQKDLQVMNRELNSEAKLFCPMLQKNQH